MTNDFLASVKSSKAMKCEENVKKVEKDEEGVKVEKKVIAGPSKKLATDMEKN